MWPGNYFLFILIGLSALSHHRAHALALECTNQDGYTYYSAATSQCTQYNVSSNCVVSSPCTFIPGSMRKTGKKPGIVITGASTTPTKPVSIAVPGSGEKQPLTGIVIGNPGDSLSPPKAVHSVFKAEVDANPTTDPVELENKLAEEEASTLMKQMKKIGAVHQARSTYFKTPAASLTSVGSSFVTGQESSSKVKQRPRGEELAGKSQVTGANVDGKNWEGRTLASEPTTHGARGSIGSGGGGVSARNESGGSFENATNSIDTPKATSRLSVRARLAEARSRAGLAGSRGGEKGGEDPWVAYMAETSMDSLVERLRQSPDYRKKIREQINDLLAKDAAANQAIIGLMEAALAEAEGGEAGQFENIAALSPREAFAMDSEETREQVQGLLSEFGATERHPSSDESLFTRVNNTHRRQLLSGAVKSGPK